VATRLIAGLYLEKRWLKEFMINKVCCSIQIFVSGRWKAKRPELV